MRMVHWQENDVVRYGIWWIWSVLI